MHGTSPFRKLASLVLLTGLSTCLTATVEAQRAVQVGQLRRAAMGQNQRPQNFQAQRRGAPPPNANKGAKGDHLAEWMNKHSNLTPEQQQQALEREPGFRDYPPATQQRLRDRLSQLNAMSPQRRAQILNRNEAMERLTPEQRGQVRGAMQQLGSLPPDQMRYVARTFRQLRDLPPEQRMAAMSRYPLNEPERSTLVNLLRVEPMLPPPEPPQPR